jgi:type I restriction enzyme S subunit
LNNFNTVLPLYLYQFLKTQKIREELIERGNGVGIKSLNQGSLSSLLIPFPESLETQQTIVRQLDALRAETQRLEAVYRQKLEDLEELKKSLLIRIFRIGGCTGLGFEDVED